MKVQTPFEHAAVALYERLARALSDEVLGMYEGEPVAAPEVSLGMPAKRRPASLVWVELLPRPGSERVSASVGQMQVSFSVGVYLIATSGDRETAMRRVTRWADAVFMGIMADATLGRAVDSAIPSMGDSGYEPTTDKRYLAAMEIQVTCSKFFSCPQGFREVIEKGKDDD